MNGSRGQIGPPADCGVYQREGLVNVCNRESAAGGQVIVKAGHLERLNFRTAPDGRIAERGFATGRVGIQVVIEEVDFSAVERAGSGRIATIPGTNHNVSESDFAGGFGRSEEHT